MCFINNAHSTEADNNGSPRTRCVEVRPHKPCCFARSEALWLFAAFDVGNRISHGANLLGLLVGNLNTKLLLQLHDKFHGIERISTQVLCESRVESYFILRYT